MIEFSEKNRAQVQTAVTLNELVGAVEQLNISTPRPVIVLVGGAGGIHSQHRLLIRQVIQELSIVAEQVGAIIVDGGTDSGVMADIGRARSESGHSYPLVGVAVKRLVTWPGMLDSLQESSAPLDSNHTAFILVAGSNWGDEVAYLARTGTLLAGKKPSVTILLNGGLIAADDLQSSINEGRQIIVLAGTGRYADKLASNPPDSSFYKIMRGDDGPGLRKELLHRLE